MRNRKFQSCKSLPQSYVPYTPIAVSSALVSAQALAKRLAVHATELTDLSRLDREQVELKKLELLEKIEECETGYENLILGTEWDINQLFYHLNLSLQIEGNRFEAASMCVSNPNDVALRVKLEQLETRAELAHSSVQSHLDLLKLDMTELSLDDGLCTGKLLDACINKLQEQQLRWKDNRMQAMALSMQIQMESVYGAAADCLIDVCQFGLHQQISIEPIPKAQEDALVAMATCIDLPFSGAWPVLEQRMHKSQASKSFSTTQQGDGQ
jgi:hypothetical protein